MADRLRSMDLRVVVRVLVATAVGGLLLGLCAAAIGVPHAQVTVGVVLRAVFVLVLLAFAVPGLLNGLRPAADLASLQTSVLVGATAGYLLDPLSWGGRAFVAQLLFDPGLVAFVVDGVLWVAVTWAASTLRVRSSQRPAAARSGRMDSYLP